MAGSGGRLLFYRNTKANVLRIFRALKKSRDDGEDYLSVSEIARRTGLHRWTVSRTIDLWMSHFVEVIIPEELEHIGLKIKLIRLANPRVTEDGVLRSLEIRL